METAEQTDHLGSWGVRRRGMDLVASLHHAVEAVVGVDRGPVATGGGGVDLGPDETPRGLVLRPALLGFVAMVAIAVGASLPSSPFKLEMPGAWFFGVPSTDQASTWGVYFTLAAMYGGLLLLMRVWWGMARLYARNPGVAFQKMLWVFALWALPMLVIAPLFSRDVYSYAAQGEMVSRHLNPYLYGPFQLGNNSFTAPVDPLWGNTPAPYGPLFMQIDGWFTQLTFHNELATVVLLRLLALAGVLMVAACIPRLAGHYHRDTAEVFTLAVLNPVVMLHLIGGAHNDALMLGLLVVGITLAKEHRPVLGIVMCTLATAVKVPAALGVVYIAWGWLGPGIPVRERLRPIITAGLLSLGILAAISLESGLGWGWLNNLGTPGVVRSWMAPATALGFIGGDVAHLAGLAIRTGAVLTVTRFLGLLGAALIGLWLLFNSERVGPLKAMGLTMLIFVALAPVVQPWYLSWGLVLLAPVAVGRLRTLLIGLSIVSAFLELPGATQLLNMLIHGNPLSIVLTLLWLLFVLTIPLATWEHRRSVRGPDPKVPVEVAAG